MKSLCYLLLIASLFDWVRPQVNPNFNETATRIRLEVPGYATIEGGQARSAYRGRPYYFFHNLKYGKPPVGERRFLPPEPVDPYPEDEVLDAWWWGKPCYPDDGGVEDCLIVDVDTPRLPGNFSDPDTSYDNLLPVMVWLHGGAFSFGAIYYYFGFNLMDHDVVLVKAQYRLSAMGWLSLDTDEVPGNAGTFDQIEALRWVQKYIKYFGGDPNRVTVFGESAGGASASLLLLAPQAKDLIHGVIAQSGSMLADWALDRQARKHGLRIAELTGCPMEPYEDLLYCLRHVDVAVLKRAESDANREDRWNGGLGFTGCSPVIQYAGKERVLTKEPRALMDAGEYNTHAAVFMGANIEEGLYAISEFYRQYVRPHDYEFDEEFMKYGLIPAVFGSLGVRDDTGALADVLSDKYLAGFQIGNFSDMLPGLIDMGGVFFLKAGGWQTVAVHSKHNPRAYWYSYEFHNVPEISILPLEPPIPTAGVSHADEVPMLFAPVPFMGKNATRTKKHMLQLWTTFATYGELTPEGVDMMEDIPFIPPYTRKDPWYVAFTNDGTVVRKDYTETYTYSGDRARAEKMRNKNEN